MNIKKIKPLFTKLLTTADKYTEAGETFAGSPIIDVKKVKQGLKEYQTVVAVGTSVKDIKEGDIVCINPSRYAVRKFNQNSLKNDLMENEVTSFQFNVVTVDGKDCLLLDTIDIDFIVEDYVPDGV